jgi:hypothetical protein
VALYVIGMLMVAVSTDSVAAVLAVAACWGIALEVILTAEGRR